MSEYDADILIWSEQQAALLRRRAAGELVNDAELDWLNIAGEIEDMGSNRLHAAESLLVQALRHTLKAEAWPLSRDAPPCLKRWMVRCLYQCRTPARPPWAIC